MGFGVAGAERVQIPAKILVWTELQLAGYTVAPVVAGVMPAAGADNNGQFTTGVPVGVVPNDQQTGISTIFGPGRGNWLPAHVLNVEVHIVLSPVVQQGGIGQIANVVLGVVEALPGGVVPGNLIVNICNLGNFATGANGITVVLKYLA